jgi:CO dehydrogenase nickel-insertion accessory protein CooC1
MAEELGIKSLFIVVNKITSKEERNLVRDNLKEFEILGELPYSEKVRRSDLNNYSPCVSDSEFKAEIEKIALKIDELTVDRKAKQTD